MALANAMPGIPRLDINGHYIYINQLYAEPMGYRPEELVAQEAKYSTPC